MKHSIIFQKPLSGICYSAMAILCILSMGLTVDEDKYPQAYKYAQYFAKYSNSQPAKDAIEHNWNQYFGSIINKDISATHELFNLRLDGYGCVYPDDSILSGIQADQFETSFSNDLRDLQNCTIFQLFQTEATANIIRKNIKQIASAERQALYNSLLGMAERNDVDSFTETWDAVFTQIFIEALQKRVCEKDSVVFFIHGYNVPYSLANLQCIEFMDLASQVAHINTDNYLFVPVYWPSNAMKNCRITQSGFDIKDKQSPKNGILWGHYSNRCYYAALTLRQILCALPDCVKTTRIFSHSLGATIATTALIDTRGKLQDYPYDSNITFSALCPQEKAYLKKKQRVNYDIVKEMEKCAPPDRKIRVFMNAAAIPGISTFSDLSPLYGSNYYWMSGYNPNDDKLEKRFWRYVKFKEKHHGSTTLGADKDHEVVNTTTVVHNMFPYHFVGVRTGTQDDHDIFAYQQQQEYRDAVKTFFSVW